MKKGGKIKPSEVNELDIPAPPIGGFCGIGGNIMLPATPLP